MIGLLMLVCLADNSECRQMAPPNFTSNMEICEQAAAGLAERMKNHGAYVASYRCIDWGEGA